MRLLLALALAISMGSAAHAATEADRAAIRTMIEQQIEAFKADDSLRAFSFASPSLQTMFGSEGRFMAMVRDGYQPVYRPRRYAPEDVVDGPQGPTMSVRIEDQDGINWIALYTLEQQPDGSWRISGCFLTRDPGQNA